MNEIITDGFILALQDYYFLINRYYSRTECLKLTGNRYMLNKMQRIVLSRGVFRMDEADRRINKKVTTFTRKQVYIDGYNVLFTIGNYLLGRPVFISNDSFLRDAGEVHGKLHKGKPFLKALDLLLRYLVRFRQKEYIFLLDQPVPGSIDIKQLINELIRNSPMKGEARIIPDPDEVLIRLTDGIIATSDSEVIDQTDKQVIDVAFEVLTSAFQPTFINLSELLTLQV